MGKKNKKRHVAPPASLAAAATMPIAVDDILEEIDVKAEASVPVAMADESAAGAVEASDADVACFMETALDGDESPLEHAVVAFSETHEETTGYQTSADEGIVANDVESGAGENSSDGVAADLVGEESVIGPETLQADGAAVPDGLGDDELTGLLEALIFASDKPLTLQRIRQLTRIADVERLERLLATIIAATANEPTRGILLQCVSGGYQFRSHSRYSEWVQQLIAGRPTRLSRAQLETLAIVAYRQPVTRAEIDEVRGVDSGGTLKVLHDRGLIRALGRKEDVGRPLLYGTTKEFLDFFSLADLRELPTLREYAELTDESRDKVRAMGMEVDDVTAPNSAELAEAMVEMTNEQGEAEVGVAAEMMTQGEEVDGSLSVASGDEAMHNDDAAFAEPELDNADASHNIAAMAPEVLVGDVATATAEDSVEWS